MSRFDLRGLRGADRLRRIGFVGWLRVFGVMLWVVSLLATRVPDSTAALFADLALLAAIVVVPRLPRTLVPVALAGCLAADFIPGGATVLTAAATAFTLFIAVGYLYDIAAGVGLGCLYAVAEVTCAVWIGSSSVAVNGLRGVIAGMTDAARRSMEHGGIGALSVGAPVPAWMLWLSGLLLSLICNGFAIAFGRAARSGTDARDRAARAQHMVDRLTREQQLAHVIHDSVANDMSVIAMLAWRAKAGLDGNGTMSSTDGAGLGETLDLIYARSHHALDRVHEVIDVLDGRLPLAALEHGPADDGPDTGGDSDGTAKPIRPATSVSTATSDFTSQLERYMEDQDRAMAMLGLHGVSRVTTVDADPEPSPTQTVRCAVLGLVEEIYANIVRHAAWNDDAATDADPAYSLFVTVTATNVHVAEVNAVADAASAAVLGTRHGNGLRMQREVVASLGGALNAAAQDGTWTIAADIPLA